MNIDVSNIKVGDKFSTENKLIRALGLEPKKGRNRNFQIIDIQRYLSYEKTGKISRGKKTNEIIIIEIFEKPIKKKRKQQEGIYKASLIESFRIIQSGQYTRSELMKYCGLIDDCTLVSTYTYLREDISPSEYQNYRDVSNYKNKFKKDFQGHTQTAFGSLKQEGFDYNYTYLVAKIKDAKRKDLVLATKEQHRIIKETEDKLQKEIEEKYNKSFASIKFNPKQYREYLDNVDKKLLALLGIYSHIVCYDIMQIGGREKYNTPDYALYLQDEVYPKLKALYHESMEKYINRYKHKYTSKPKISEAGFGRREFQPTTTIYTLKDSGAVWKAHLDIFGYRYSDVDSMVLNDDEEIIEEDIMEEEEDFDFIFEEEDIITINKKAYSSKGTVENPTVKETITSEGKEMNNIDDTDIEYASDTPYIYDWKKSMAPILKAHGINVGGIDNYEIETNKDSSQNHEYKEIDMDEL